MILLLIVLAIIGSIEGQHSTPAKPQAATRHGVAKAKRPAPAPTTRVLLDVEGQGIKTTQRFDAPDEWAIAWTYDCSAFDNRGNFIVNVEGDVDDAAANELGTSGRDVSYVHSGGSVYLSINSECAWHVRAVAQ